MLSSLQQQFGKFFLPFFCNITKYECAKFHVTSIFLSGFMQGGEGGGTGTMCPPSMVRQKYLRADKVNSLTNVLVMLELTFKYFLKIA